MKQECSLKIQNKENSVGAKCEFLQQIRYTQAHMYVHTHIHRGMGKL